MTAADGTHAALRAWANGTPTTEAATELLIGSSGGRFARPGNPWVRTGPDGAAWIDWDAINESTVGGLSGGQRRILLVAASLAGRLRVDLGDAVTGMGCDNVRLLASALAHASGCLVGTGNLTELGDVTRALGFDPADFQGDQAES